MESIWKYKSVEAYTIENVGAFERFEISDGGRKYKMESFKGQNESSAMYQRHMFSIHL